MNMAMVHSINRSGLVDGLGTFCSCATLHAAWREDCMIPSPESRLVCIPSFLFCKKLKMYYIIFGLCSTFALFHIILKLVFQFLNFKFKK